MELDDESLQSTLAYVLPDACFEIEFDWREEAAFVLVCRRTPEGRRPGYYTHGGLTMRVHLAEALERTGLAEAGLANDHSRHIGIRGRGR